MPQALKWMYIMELKHQGFVTEMNFESILNDCDLGSREIVRYTVKAPCHELQIFMDSEGGILEATLNVNRERAYQPIYELGKPGPVEYVPVYSPTTAYSRKF